MQSTITVHIGATSYSVGTAPQRHTVWSSIPERASRVIPPLMDSSQVYYWSRVWQEGEQETLNTLAKGEGKTFASGKEAISWLLDNSDD